MVALTVPWKSMALFFVPNWFPHNNAENSDTRVVLDPCWIMLRNFSSIPAHMSNMHHLSWFTYWLVAVDLEIPLVMSMIMLATIYRRWCLWTDFFVMKPLSVVGGWVWSCLRGIYLRVGVNLRANPWWYYLLPWFAGSIETTHYWWGSIETIEILFYGDTLWMGRMIICASILRHLNCP